MYTLLTDHNNCVTHRLKVMLRFSRFRPKSLNNISLDERSSEAHLPQRVALNDDRDDRGEEQKICGRRDDVVELVPPQYERAGKVFAVPRTRSDDQGAHDDRNHGTAGLAQRPINV